jgi:hypothetical protein
MLRVGTDSAGFSIDSPASGGIVVVGWGFWSVEVATAFALSVIDACRARPRGAALVFEMSNLKPMRDEGQQSFSAILRALPGLGVARTSMVTTNPLTRMQLTRLATESGINGVEWVNGTNEMARGM